MIFKKILPVSLLGRSIIIIFVPIFLLVIITSVIFYQTSWNIISKRLTESVVADINVIVKLIKQDLEAEAIEIDLVRLTQSAGVRLIVDEVIGLDHQKRQVLFRERPPLAYDLLSIGVGSRPTSQGVEISPHCFTPIKPMQTFLSRLRTDLKRKSADPKEITIVGGGLGSLEIAFCFIPKCFNFITRSAQKMRNFQNKHLPTNTT